ncbi:hypothetical protein SDC9_102799 [bioreactor metagenome]|uniref:Uncharacterized protein n=1 Tax=bioreactor metagenome TaxID=1076179 RepID=A0A645AUM8_9ZZZZ
MPDSGAVKPHHGADLPVSRVQPRDRGTDAEPEQGDPGAVVRGYYFADHLCCLLNPDIPEKPVVGFLPVAPGVVFTVEGRQDDAIAFRLKERGQQPEILRYAPDLVNDDENRVHLFFPCLQHTGTEPGVISSSAPGSVHGASRKTAPRASRR